MADDDHHFESADSGASSTYPKQCSALRKNEYVVIKGRPCKIVEMSTSKTGKHGHAKVHLVALDVFTGKKYEDICPSTHNMSCPVVTRSEYQAVSVDGEYLSLMDDNGGMREDLKVPTPECDVYAQLKDKLEKLNEGETFMVTVLKAMGEEMVVGTKQDKSS
ncbi:eukaryotic translation initiation factor 5A-1-like [Babylonia areolata]|uniref:eukaryotic translation initiation factor 5A-1-like n=1 Tax=Babylonia areolata TaxID=304850 RepID=UPI003FD21540